MTHLWEIKHPYECEEGHYFGSSGETTVWRFKTWADFLAEWGWDDTDPDMNLLFRFDWEPIVDEDGVEVEFGGDTSKRQEIMRLVFFHQRKGYHSTCKVRVARDEEPAIREYLEFGFAHMRRLWAPISGVE